LNPTPTGNRPPPATPVFDSRDLFGEATRIHIQHAGKTYVLQITRQGKLILTR